MGRKLAAVVLAFTALATAASSTAAAYERDAVLERVASHFAQRNAEVRCPSQEEWVGDPIWGPDANAQRGWAYTNMLRDYMVLHPALCAGAARLGSPELPAWQRAAGALVLVHEAFHIRRWEGRWREARVECRAIRAFPAAARLLGASPELANELLPHALAVHLRMGTLFPEYRDPKCALPVWTPPIAP